MDKVSFFVFNIFINSLLAFFTVTLLVEGIVFLCRIRQGRFAAILRMVPLLKLPLDLFSYDFSKWAFTHGINPLTCEKGSRTFSVMLSGGDFLGMGWTNSASNFLPVSSYIKFIAQGNTTFTIADVIGQFINSSLLNSLCLCLLLLSIGCVIKKIFMYRHFAKTLKPLEKNQQYGHRKIRNQFIKKLLKKDLSVIVTASSLSGTAFVAGLLSPTVYIPASLSKTLLQKEYEAVLAHEVEHIRYKDTLIRFILDIIGSAFFWIPTRWLQKRIEDGQEIGCDLRCKNYKVKPIDLASAIFKSAKISNSPSRQSFAPHLAKHLIQTRVKLLLESNSNRFKKLRFIFCCLAATFTFFCIFLGRFWTF